MSNTIILELDELIRKLEKRNLKFKDKDKAKSILKNITYFKLKEFTYSYLEENKKFKDNIYFEDILNHYYLDKKLRMLFLSLIESFEIALKTRIINKMSLKNEYEYIKFEFADEIYKEKIEILQKQILKKNNKILNEETDYDFKILKNFRYKNKKLENILPIWIIIEMITLGEMIEIFKVMKKNILFNICNDFENDVESFLVNVESIKKVRNMAAHNNDILSNDFKKHYGSIFNILIILIEYLRKINIEINNNEIKELILEIKMKTFFITDTELNNILEKVGS